MGKAEVWTPRDPAWRESLERLPHDVFHRPEYHTLPGLGHQGTPCAFCYQEGADRLFVWPHLMVPIPGTANFDVTSVYGYAGPLSTGDAEFRRRAWEAVSDHWRLLGVVSVFTRLHPILGNAEMMATLPRSATEGLRRSGSTVSIDLTLPSSDQVRGYQKVLRQEIRTARDRGFVTAEDCQWADVDSFVDMYRDTMMRRSSRCEYLIDEAWVQTFRQALGPRAHLFVTRWQGAVASALLAIEQGPFLHAHLAGLNAGMTAHSPLKIMLDDVREWGTRRGLRHFHLGGGVGGREDSLFRFKRRFSPITHQFHTGRWIVDSALYTELERDHRRTLPAGLTEAQDYFPSYRYRPAPMPAQG
jgi:hypothetical protein